jgi:PAT family beta-lactamase induction signal transducer AmpG
LLLNLLPAWLRSEGVDLKTIGFFRADPVSLTPGNSSGRRCWTASAYPGFGRRSGWMLLTQFGLLFTIGFIGGLSPKDNIWPILWLATLLAFLLSATQDIAVDAFRREILE